MLRCCCGAAQHGCLIRLFAMFERPYNKIISHLQDLDCALGAWRSCTACPRSGRCKRCSGGRVSEGCTGASSQQGLVQGKGGEVPVSPAHENLHVLTPVLASQQRLQREPVDEARL